MPLLMAFFACCCIWIITDMAYGVRMWEISGAGWIKRLEALAVMFLSGIFSYIFFCRIANCFLGKKKGNNLFLRIQEYGIVFVFILLVVNAALFVVFIYINRAGFRWGEVLLINTAAVPLFLFYYILIRDHILFTKYTESTLQLEKVRVDHLESELKLLKAQYHPHFLFNALNTVYFQIDEENEEAIETIDLLSSLLRYQLYDINGQVPVHREMDYLQNYIRFQKLRMTERLQLQCYIDPALQEQTIHPLLFQPLLENAFKYVGGDYKLNVDIRPEGNAIHFKVTNSVALTDVFEKEKKGIGIENLKRRLDLLYPGKHELTIRLDDHEYAVDLIIELSE